MTEYTIGVALMVKDEAPRILETLNTLADFASVLIVLDTGSTDDTMDIMRQWCTDHEIPLSSKTTQFTDFQVTRNELLDLVNEIACDFCLLLDAADELRGGAALKSWIQRMAIHENGANGWYIPQIWESAGSKTRFQNVRLIRPSKQLRYIGRVHEYLSGVTYGNVSLPSEIHIYQDRRKELKNRSAWDLRILQEDYARDPGNARTVFYLARTCYAVGKYEEAYRLYALRETMDNIVEERFECLLSCARLARDARSQHWDGFWKSVTDATVLDWNLRAIALYPRRIEPYMELVRWYDHLGMTDVAFSYCQVACTLPVPVHATMFLDWKTCMYTRWHFLGRLAFYVQQYEVGKDACLRAMANAPTPEEAAQDLKNLDFYLDALYKHKHP